MTVHIEQVITNIKMSASTGAQAIIKVSGHQYWWLAGGYDLDIFSLVVTWWIVAGGVSQSCSIGSKFKCFGNIRWLCTVDIARIK